MVNLSVREEIVEKCFIKNMRKLQSNTRLIHKLTRKDFLQILADYYYEAGNNVFATCVHFLSKTKTDHEATIT